MIIAITDVDWKALPAQLCPAAGARHLFGDRSVLVDRLAPVLDRLERQGRRR